MAGMKGANSFLVARYVVFGLLVICNAIICSVAVWNSSLIHSTQSSQVNFYLIFLSAFLLALVFTLIFVELLCINTLTTRVWFECAWVALFWIMELAGGAALIAIESGTLCAHETSPFLDVLCTSERVLIAFTWMCTIMLLIYLLALVFISASQHHKDPNIWVSDVRALRAAAVRRCSLSTPNSPLTATRLKKPASVDIYIPHPVRPQPVRTFHHRTGLSADYEIQPFRPVFVAPEQMDVPHSSNLPEAIPLPPFAAAPIIPSFMKPIPALPETTGNARSLLLSQFDLPRELVSSITYASSSLPSGPVPSQSNTLSSPSPLGDWPRQDVMQQPVKRKPPPPSAFEFPDQHMVTTTSTERVRVPADTVTQPRARRPSGPRLRMPSEESGHRPAPLDLYGISNYETGRRDDAGFNV